MKRLLGLGIVWIVKIISQLSILVLSDLSNGEHRLIIYAEDLSGNIGTSDLIVFTISTENEIPSQLWVVAL